MAEWLRHRIANPVTGVRLPLVALYNGLSSNGRIRDFESRHTGSTPVRPTEGEAHSLTRALGVLVSKGIPDPLCSCGEMADTRG